MYLSSFSDDHNRIVLKPLEDYEDCQGEFINACHIDVSNLLRILGYCFLFPICNRVHACYSLFL